jgi:hypothetical protein
VINEAVSSQDQALTSLVPFLAREDAATLTEDSLPLWPPRHVTFDSRATLSRLADGSIRCPAFDQDLLDRFLQFLERTGAFRPGELPGSVLNK